mmetsp:Transcript_23795/g.40515  ORF Transcript_23795/g.40515 Transcript_23795/m.40515 type:complete len:1333 (-) Transcript_23795:623-4621(-)
MINHLLAEEEGDEDGRDRDSAVSRLSSVSRPSWSTPVLPISEEFENKKNSLKLTNIRTTIPTANTTKKKAGVSAFTTYIIAVETGGAQWNVRRRFSDFYYMHRLLKVYIPKKNLPRLPPKKYLGSSTSSAFVEERRRLLERYLQKLVVEPACWMRSDLVQFLDNPQSILMFTWNFERMQKMQEMLGTMTVENQNQTEKLTSELENARMEVIVLKERIAQMEMLFLQQATGAAASKLHSAAMTTLSQGSNPRLSLLHEDDEEEEEEEEDFGEDDDETPDSSYDRKTYAQALQDKVVSDMSQMTTSVSEEERGSSEQPTSTLQTEKNGAAVTVKPNEVVEILKLAKEDDSGDAQSMSTGSGEYNNPYILDYDVTDAVELQQRMVLMSRNLQHAVKLSNGLLEEKFTYAAKQSSGKMLVMADETGESTFRERDSLMSVGSNTDAAEGILSELLVFEDSTIPPSRISEGQEEDSMDRDTGSEVSFTFGDVGPAYISTKCQSGWSKRLAGRMDEILAVLIPTEESIADRMNISHFVKSMISSSIGGQLFPIGSFCSRTFLPRGGMDLCAFLTPVQSESWFVRVNEALCISSMADNKVAKENAVNVRNVSFINSDVKVVKSIMNNVEVDVSVNQISALYAQALLDKINNFIGENHLFKRSCILIKLWCKFESCRHTAADVGGISGVKNGRLSTWSIMVMTIWVFNKYGRDIQNTFQALSGFLCYFSSFEWNRYAITVHGPVLVEDLGEAADVREYYAPPRGGGFIPTDILDSMRVRFLRTFEAIYHIEKKTNISGGKSGEGGSKDHKDQSQGQEQDGAPTVAFSESMCELDSIMGVQVYSHYRRGVVNVMDPIQPKNNLTHSLDTVGARALMDALLGGRSSLVKLCLDSQAEMMDAQEKLQGLKANSPDADPDTMALLSVRDIPLMRTFFENSTRHIAEISRGHSLPPGVDEQEASGYKSLKSNQRELELAMKHAELILGNIVTPEALARLIVYALEVKGPLPVGEVGKLLQEATGNENLASALKTAYKGLKKVLEGFRGIFNIGTDHPFNPQVSLTDEYIAKRDSNVMNDSAVADLYVFEPAPPAELRVPSSDGSDSSPNEGQFVQLTKKGKAASFKGDRKEDGSPRDQASRSNSFGSSADISNRKPPSARSPKKYNNKIDQQGGIRLSAQEYQQYQQYQLHMMQEQQRYQQFMQQQQQQQHHQTGGHQGPKGDTSVIGSDNLSTSPNSIPPPISIQPHAPSYPGGHGGAYMPPYPPAQQHMYPPHSSPGSSPVAGGGYYYDQSGNVYYPSTNAMAGLHPPHMHHSGPTSPTAGRGVAMRRQAAPENNKTKNSQSQN